MSRGFDLIRRHLSGRLTGKQDAAANINDASSSDAASDTPWLDAMSGGIRQGVPTSARSGQDTEVDPKDVSDDAEPPLTATQRLRRQLPGILRPRQENAQPTPQQAQSPSSQPRSLASDSVAMSPPPSAPPPGTHAPRQMPQPVPPQGPQYGSSHAAEPSQGSIPATAYPSSPPVSGQQAQATPVFEDQRVQNRRQSAQGRDKGQIDRRHAKAARRHSVFVAVMKGLLPSLVIGLVAVFFFYSYDFRPNILPDNVTFDPGTVSISTDGIKMVAPKLTGVDAKQQTFEVKADAAIQDRQDPAKVTLEGIDARINLKEGGTVGISAQNGIYNTDLNQIWLRDDLEIRSSEGYVAQLSEAQVDFKNGVMVSNHPVLIFTNNGVISASGVQVLEGGEKVKFSGPVVLNLNGSAGETQ